MRRSGVLRSYAIPVHYERPVCGTLRSRVLRLLLGRLLPHPRLDTVQRVSGPATLSRIHVRHGSRTSSCSWASARTCSSLPARRARGTNSGCTPIASHGRRTSLLLHPTAAVDGLLVAEDSCPRTDPDLRQGVPSEMRSAKELVEREGLEPSTPAL
jgi:hypothetical protein